ncbi:MAG TPA: hypothetical protein VHS56_11675 [Candidatus Cybelea sp.]|nr:hypothetical protein [Candidatus Cybelea sp.]
MRIGSAEHKELFCRSFLDTHEAYDPEDWAWPELDDISLARLRAIPIWTMALEAEVGAGTMLAKYGQKEPDELVRRTIELQGYEEDRHGRTLQCMIDRYALAVTPHPREIHPTRKAFVEFGYNECADSFAGFGIFRLAREAQILPDGFTSLFTRLLREEARHIVFFVNWVAWDRCRRGLRGALQALPALLGYSGAVVRRVAGSKDMQSDKPPENAVGLFEDSLSNLTPASFLRACVEENDRYMSAFDPRLLRPRVIPALGGVALQVAEAIERVRANGRKASPAGPSS